MCFVLNTSSLKGGISKLHKDENVTKLDCRQTEMRWQEIRQKITKGNKWKILTSKQIDKVNVTRMQMQTELWLERPAWDRSERRCWDVPTEVSHGASGSCLFRELRRPGWRCDTKRRGKKSEIGIGRAYIKEFYGLHIMDIKMLWTAQIAYQIKLWTAQTLCLHTR